MTRAFLFVLDSFGIGGAADADDYGDGGSNTLGHIADAARASRADRTGLRAGPLSLPNLNALGLGRAAAIASGRDPLGPAALVAGAVFGAAEERSKGKDTPSGHWEIAGLPVPFDWGYFPQTVPALPRSLVADIVREAGLPGILGDRHASGTDIIRDEGEEHLRTGRPILYTSADSVLQIAAHEERFGLERLHALCAIARRLVDPLAIGRVIARPFLGDDRDSFFRTANRRDYAVPPPEPTLLDRVEAAGGAVHAVGKVPDIFAGRGISQSHKAAGNEAVWEESLRLMRQASAGDLVFSNFVDFDMMFGHRRDVAGYAAALEAFDRRLPEALALLQPGDRLLLCADHGCDPTWTGTDHTRERVPVLGLAPGTRGGSIGLRPTFADIGETVAAHLSLKPGPHGHSFEGEILA